MKLFELEDQFVLYGSYHSNFINVIIHIICVWPLIFSALVFCAYSPPFAPSPSEVGMFHGHQYIIFNLAFFVALVYAIYFVILDNKGGWLGAFLVISCWIGANAFVSGLGRDLAWKVAVGIQVVAWTAQFIGHGVFEGRRPALVDNLLQSLLMAPYFVLLEVLQMVFGYEPSPGFRQRVQLKVKDNIQEYRMKKEM